MLEKKTNAVETSAMRVILRFLSLKEVFGTSM